ARYDKFFDPGNPAGPQDYSGNRLNLAPRWSANGVIDYRYPVSDRYDLRMSTNWTYRSKIFFTQSNLPELSDQSRLLGNARLGLEPSGGKGVAVAAYVNNLTNKRPTTLAFDAPAPGAFVKYFSPGRTYGVDLLYRW